MNGYIGFFNNVQVEVHADTQYEALCKAQEHFKPSKSKKHMVHVVLCEIDNEQVTHLPLN